MLSKFGHSIPLLGGGAGRYTSLEAPWRQAEVCVCRKTLNSLSRLVDEKRGFELK